MSDQVNGRRVARVLITQSFIETLVRGGQMTVETPVVPETARFLSAHFDFDRNLFVAIFEDESFDLVPEGAMVSIIGKLSADLDE